MKTVLVAVLLVLFVFALPARGQNGPSRNGEKRYDRDSILAVFDRFADRYAPAKGSDSAWSKVWVQDLTDTLNSSQSKLYFADRHVYVFSPARINYVKYDYHHIAVLNNGELKLFKAVNCSATGDPVQAVEGFLSAIQLNDPQVITRVRRCTAVGWNSIMRKLWADDHNLIYERFECAGE